VICNGSLEMLDGDGGVAPIEVRQCAGVADAVSVIDDDEVDVVVRRKSLPSLPVSVLHGPRPVSYCTPVWFGEDGPSRKVGSHRRRTFRKRQDKAGPG
jgi:hypothetical protein